MAKVYAFQELTKPASITGTPVSGGTLANNTTYYYRVIGCRYNGQTASYWVGKTQSSDEFSATTNTVNKSVQITFTQPAGEGIIAYRVFRWTTAGGMLNNASACIAYYPQDSAVRSGTTITLLDTGYANTGGNTYLNIDTDPHGVLTVTGTTSGDKVSIVDIYNASVAGGWNAITKIDSQTYLVNCYLILTNQYWADSYKTIIFADSVENAGGDVALGLVTGGNKTYGSCNIIITSMWLGNMNQTTLNAYRTNFLYVYPRSMIGAGLGLTALSWSSGMVLDCTCELFRAFAPNSAANCTLKNFTMSGYDNSFGTGRANFINVRMLAGSRVWQFSTQTVYGKGVFIDGGAAALLTGGPGILNLVDSQFTTAFMINSSSTGTVLNDKISFNLNIVDQNQTAISGASVKIYDTDSTLVVDVTTDVSGNIVEQEITRRQYTVTGTTQNGPFNKYPFTIVISKAGYETYTEKVSYLLSLAVVKTVSLKPIVPIRLLAGDGASLALQPELGSNSILKKI